MTSLSLETSRTRLDQPLLICCGSREPPAVVPSNLLINLNHRWPSHKRWNCLFLP